MKLSRIAFSLLFLTVAGCSIVNFDATQDEALTQAEKAKMCQDLREEIDTLKSNPLKRGAHLEYYQSECIEDH